MPLGCDCFPGCWGRHSEGWPRLTFDTDAEQEIARRLVIKHNLVPYGSYITVGKELRLEEEKYVDLIRSMLSEPA